MIIAIDGPAGSGKSTVAKLLAQELGIEYIDSGAIYRTLAYFGVRQWGEAQGHAEEIAAYFTQAPSALRILYRDHRQIMLLQGKELQQEIRGLKVTAQVRWVANHKGCRDFANAQIRAIANQYACVVDGRDIGTVVFPRSLNKFYLNADPRVRAVRRAQELGIALAGAEFEALVREIQERDQNDMQRELAPLQKATDAIEIDSTGLTPQEVLASIRQQLVL